ncbi:MAG: hypothetical protein LBU61_04235 [Coriobacteriales bacterium]|jgi:hypothetical protein|nr:hypothetical protein [Coriobacteriales bacterium]
MEFYNDYMNNIKVDNELHRQIVEKTRGVQGGGVASKASTVLFPWFRQPITWRVIAVVIGVVIMFSGVYAGYATNLFGMKKLVLGETEIHEIGPNNDKIVTVISLQGYIGSPEYEATKEWHEYFESCEINEEVLFEADRIMIELYPDDYLLYLYYRAYTPEMVEKLLEIAKEYNLTLLEEPRISMRSLSPLLGANSNLGGYMYSNGTFRFDGHCVINGKGIGYQFSNCRKGYLDPVSLNIGNPNDYTEWDYRKADGTMVTIAMSPLSSLLIVELDNSLAIINVLPNAYWPIEDQAEITAQFLEAFAESFDFLYLNEDTYFKAAGH